MSDHGDIQNLWSPSRELSENNTGNYTGNHTENYIRVYYSVKIWVNYTDSVVFSVMFFHHVYSF